MSGASILDRARRAPASLAFRELCRLVESAGYQLARIQGSHRIYVHENRPDLPLINLQGRSGKAKPYQVRQVLQIVDDNGLMEDGK